MSNTVFHVFELYGLHVWYCELTGEKMEHIFGPSNAVQMDLSNVANNITMNDCTDVVRSIKLNVYHIVQESDQIFLLFTQ